MVDVPDPKRTMVTVLPQSPYLVLIRSSCDTIFVPYTNSFRLPSACCFLPFLSVYSNGLQSHTRNAPLKEGLSPSLHSSQLSSSVQVNWLYTSFPFLEPLTLCSWKLTGSSVRKIRSASSPSFAKKKRNNRLPLFSAIFSCLSLSCLLAS